MFVVSAQMLLKFGIGTVALVGGTLINLAAINSLQINVDRMNEINNTKEQEALSRLIKDKTVMVIAHRMRMVAGANKIVVLSEGGVAEQGSPTELMERGGIFADMVRPQTEGQNWSIA